MPETHENRYAVVPAIVNGLLAWLVSGKFLIHMLFSEYRWQMIVIAIVGAIIGSICAVKAGAGRHPVRNLVVVGVVFVGTLWYQTYLADLSGHFWYEVGLAFLMVLIIVGIACYLLTLLEFLGASLVWPEE